MLLAQEAGRQRIFVKESPEEISAVYSQHTSVTADQTTKKYIGKWMKAARTVFDLQVHDQQTCDLFLDKDEGFLCVIGRFNYHSWFGHLELLNKGDSVTVTGRIAAIDRLHVHLADCQLET